MQRKNNLLARRSHRSAIAMVMAIVVIVIVATLMALALSLTTQTAKKTVDLYIYEQAVLLSKSAAEYALLRISEDGPCSPTSLDFNPPAPLDYYDINITIQYVYTAGSPCASVTDDYATVETVEQNGSVLMDISVSVNDTSITSESIRYFRRSIQKL